MNKEDILKEIRDLEEKITRIRENKSVWTNFWAGSTYNHGPYLRRLAIKKAQAKIRRLRTKLWNIFFFRGDWLNLPYH